MLLSVISLALVAYEASYDSEYTVIPPIEFYGAVFAVAATLIFIAGLYSIHRAYKWQVEKGVGIRKKRREYALALVLLVALSALLYLMQTYAIRTTSWVGTDESAFNYYAANLFVRGANPYTTSMNAVLKEFKINPTLELNGSCECSYDYPALSFVLPAFVLIGNYPYSFLPATMALVVLVSFLLFRSSKWNAYSLLPISAWFFASFYIAPGPLNKYIAASLFLVLAYIYRTRVLQSGMFLGLAASTHQISWVALPFFYVLALRESGKKAAAKSILATAAIFLIANGYFILRSPQTTIGNMLSIFLIKLQLEGPALMQLLVAFFPVSFWAPTLVMMMVFVSTLVLFYLYTRSLKMLLAIVPPMIFFLSWRGMGYFPAFIPLIVAVYYSEKGSVEDSLHGKRYMAYMGVLVVVLVALVLASAHSAYASSKTLQILNLYGPTELNRTTGVNILLYVIVNVSNNANKTEQISFHMLSRNPDASVYSLMTYNASPPAHSYTTYKLPYSLPGINAGTKLYVFVLSNDYICGIETNSAPAK